MANKYDAIMQQLGATSLKGGGSLTEERIAEIEALLPAPLPSDYRDFLRDYAGVEVLGTKGAGVGFPLREHNEQGSIYSFLGPTEKQTLADIYHQMRTNYGVLENGYRWYPGLRLVRDISVPVEEMEWPEELLEIGVDMQGNPICLAMFGLRPGAIFYWSHTLLDADNIYLVADSFDEFMNLLRRRDQ